MFSFSFFACFRVDPVSSSCDKTHPETPLLVQKEINPVEDIITQQNIKSPGYYKLGLISLTMKLRKDIRVFEENLNSMAQKLRNNMSRICGKLNNDKIKSGLSRTQKLTSGF